MECQQNRWKGVKLQISNANCFGKCHNREIIDGKLWELSPSICHENFIAKKMSVNWNAFKIEKKPKQSS